MIALLRRLWYFLRRERFSAELDEELRFHQEQRARKLEQAGRSPAEARAEARSQFGNPAATGQDSRDAWGLGSLDRLAQDLRFAIRRVRQRPSFSIPVILIIALGIGATTAMFSAVDAALFRGLPFTDPDRLVSLPNVGVPFESEMSERQGSAARTADLIDVAELGEVFSSVAAFASGALNLSDSERPLRLRVGVVTANFFATLGMAPRVGRGFTEDEGKPNAVNVAILSHALWRNQFGGADVLNRSISLNEKSYTIVGVMPAGFGFPGESDLWIPLSIPTTFSTFEPFRGFLPSRVVARLAPGVTIGAASARMWTAWERLLAPARPDQRSWAEPLLAEVRRQGVAVPLQRELVGSRRNALLILFGATTLLLLIACANVANLLLSDAAIRRREIGIREVLGASRGRVVRQLLVESVCMALTGALLGVALAPVLVSAIGALMPEDLAGAASARVDLRVLGFTTLMAILTGLGFGLWPAIAGTQGDLAEGIKTSGGYGATSGRLGRVRRGLVAAEIALTAMLLIGAGLMLRSFARLMAQETGIDAEGVATVETSFARGQGRMNRLRLINGVIERLSGQPGILAAAAVNDLPLRSGGGLSIRFSLDGVSPEDGDPPMARYLMASAEYFKTLGIPVLRGRTFRASDDSLAARVAIVNAAMARKYWPRVDPIGRIIRFSLPLDSTPITVVGLVGDVRERNLERDPLPQIYFPIDAQTPTAVAFLIRGSLPPRALMGRLTETLREVAPAQPGYNLRMMDEVISASVRPRRTNTVVLGLFAGLALLLSSLGVYAVVRYGVSQRYREFGIRIALGARKETLLSLVAGEMTGAVVVGLLLGLGGAWGLSRVLAALLYGVEARDLGTFVAVPLILLLPAAIATLIPALRAARVDPTEVLRAE
jgi:putative ABC transport system permease protein